MNKITISDSTFVDMIEGGNLYVDKTKYLWSLITGLHKGIYFLSRPRRFGKSLTVSTLEAIFQGKKELFKGLAIYDQYDWDQTYPVLHLDFGGCLAHTPQKMERYLSDKLKLIALQEHIKLQGGSPEIQFEVLIRNLSEKKPVVVLIDEYDRPILNNVNNPYVQKIISVLREFYGTLKTCNNALRFVFITGVSKFSHVSIFSDLNHLEDISMDPEYATMLGYTQAELEENFKEYIDAICDDGEMNTNRTELLKNIKEWYDGYRFHPHIQSVYNPLSIGLFFSRMMKEKMQIMQTGMKKSVTLVTTGAKLERHLI